MWTLTEFRAWGDRWLDCRFEANLTSRSLRIPISHPNSAHWVGETGHSLAHRVDRDLVDHLIAHWTLTGSANGFPKVSLDH